MNDEYVWEDINRNQYKLQDIDDIHLSNILLFIRKGGGRVSFLTEDKIKKLYAEAQKRTLTAGFTLDELIKAFRNKVHKCAEMSELMSLHDWNEW